MLNKILALSFFLLTLSILAFAQSDIRKVDFKNFTYNPYCAGEKATKIKVKNGEFSSEQKMEDYTDRFYFNVMEIKFGDLTNDGKDEAIILTLCNTGGTGNFSEGFIYTISAGKPLLLARIPGGDRAFGGLREAKVENGLLIVDRNDADKNQANCCADYAVISKFLLKGKKLELMGKPISRELYPAQRVNFPRGNSKTVLNFEVNYIKRFRIGARAGQTLTISFSSPNSDNISLSLVEGEAEVSESENKLIAKLKANGDYIIQVQNTFKLPSDVILTVEIK